MTVLISSVTIFIFTATVSYFRRKCSYNYLNCSNFRRECSYFRHNDCCFYSNFLFFLKLFPFPGYCFFIIIICKIVFWNSIFSTKFELNFLSNVFLHFPFNHFNQLITEQPPKGLSFLKTLVLQARCSFSWFPDRQSGRSLG